MAKTIGITITKQRSLVWLLSLQQTKNDLNKINFERSLFTTFLFTIILTVYIT